MKEEDDSKFAKELVLYLLLFTSPNAPDRGH